jgi:hypothetical protein
MTWREVIRSDKAKILVLVVGMTLFMVYPMLTAGPLWRGQIEPAHAQSYYRTVLKAMENGAWSLQCSRLSSAFRGTYTSSDPLVPSPVHFDRRTECRGRSSSYMQPSYPAGVTLVSIRKGPQSRMMTVEYVAHWEYERTTVKQQFVDQLVRNRFGDVRLYRRWIFEDKTER